MQRVKSKYFSESPETLQGMILWGNLETRRNLFGYLSSAARSESATGHFSIEK